MSLVRVTCTLPADVLKAADRLAKRLERSRSWVVAEALRRYVSQAGEPAPSVRAVHEAAAPPYAAPASGLGEQRLAQLEADLRLTPEQRVHEAEETLETALRARPQPRLQQLLLFASLEDYFAWKKRDLLW
jgi:hypothetical protein